MNLRLIINNSALCTVFLLCNICVGFAQEATTTATVTASDTLSYEQIAKNTVYLELLGNAGAYSLNYDRLITKNISLRVGLSYIPGAAIGVSQQSGGVNIFSISVPLSASYLLNIPETPSYLEAGLGGSLFLINAFGQFTTTTGSSVSISQTFITTTIVPMLGYRLQPQFGGFNFRAIITPLIFLTPGQPATRPLQVFTTFFGGISFGYTFYTAKG